MVNGSDSVACRRFLAIVQKAETGYIHPRLITERGAILVAPLLTAPYGQIGFQRGQIDGKDGCRQGVDREETQAFYFAGLALQSTVIAAAYEHHVHIADLVTIWVNIAQSFALEFII